MSTSRITVQDLVPYFHKHQPDQEIIRWIGHVEYLVRMMQAGSWLEFWQGLGLRLFYFADVGLSTAASDREVWLACQSEQLVLVTDNRNEDSPDSLQATI